MRPQAKPFTVEIKKSRKSSNEPHSLFGGLEEAVAAYDAPVAPDRVVAGASSAATSDPDIARVFGVAGVQAPMPAERAAPTRILPDLTARPIAPPVEEETARAPRLRASPKPRIPKPRPAAEIAIEIEVQPKAAAAPVAPIRVRVRPKDETGLARGERWKRRLPRYAR
jgi:hypothetical protein